MPTNSGDEPAAHAHALLERLFALLHDCRALVPQLEVAGAEPRGMRPLVAHCHLGLGKLYRRTGKREQAREHLTTATTMFREMDMPFLLEQAEAEQRGA